MVVRRMRTTSKEGEKEKEKEEKARKEAKETTTKALHGAFHGTTKEDHHTTIKDKEEEKEKEALPFTCIFQATCNKHSFASTIKHINTSASIITSKHKQVLAHVLLSTSIVVDIPYLHLILDQH